MLKNTRFLIRPNLCSKFPKMKGIHRRNYCKFTTISPIIKKTVYTKRQKFIGGTILTFGGIASTICGFQFIDNFGNIVENIVMIPFLIPVTYIACNYHLFRFIERRFEEFGNNRADDIAACCIVGLNVLLISLVIGAIIAM